VADAIVAAVSHKEYLAMPLADILGKLNKGGVFSDVKSAYEPDTIRVAGYKVWRV
jgi:UDP-N-acetyl-D-galactosamine dehydrogenase